MAERVSLKSFSDQKFENYQNCVIVGRKDCKEVKDKLRRENLLNSNYSIKRLPKDEVAIPIKRTAESTLSNLISQTNFRLESLDVRIKENLNPRDQLIEELKKHLDQLWTEDLKEDIPKKWEIHGDLIVLPEKTFTNQRWTSLGDLLWVIISETLRIKRIARKKSIENNCYRSPRMEMILGNNSIVRHVDNGVIYEYDITKCMFSMGNIREKLRISKMNCKDEVIVDLFAGIGYFTLPYLIHADAAFVHACEWNPDAISALKNNLKLNNVEEKCRIYNGDCRQVAPIGIANRVNLGLLPSSELGWLPACRALRSDIGGILSIHGNVDIPPSNNDVVINKRDVWWQWATKCQSSVDNIFKNDLKSEWKISILDVSRIKSYGVRVDHLVVDLNCTPIY